MCERVWECVGVCVCVCVCVPSSEEKHTADSQVGQQHEKPNGRREGIQE